MNVPTNLHLTDSALNSDQGRSQIARWTPIAASILYPWVLEAFHRAITSGSETGTASALLRAAFWLTIAFLLPLSCLAFAMGRGPFAMFAPIDAVSRRAAFVGVAAPSLFVLTGVVSGLLHSPVSEQVIWVAVWAAVGVTVTLAKPATGSTRDAESSGRLRVAHGISAALIVLFISFHLFNHLLGLLGPNLHGQIARIGRSFYRSPVVEPALVGLLLFQVAGGLRLAWRWSGSKFFELQPRTISSLARTIQIASGVYLAAFLLTHMDSAFIAARTVHQIETDWAWASGAPTGLIMDAWNIRLLPHYALGVFFIVAHLFCGLRGVLLAHHIHTPTADRIWLAGLTIGVVLSTAITCALCGLRL